MERMLVIKVRRDDSLATSSTYMNHCDSFVWGYIKDVVFKPMPSGAQGHHKEGVPGHPGGDGQEGVYGMKKRAAKLIQVEGKAFEWKFISFKRINM